MREILRDPDLVIAMVIRQSWSALRRSRSSPPTFC